MLTFNQLFFGMLLPAIVCGAFYATNIFFKKKDGKYEHLQWLTAAALGIGYIIGHIAIEGKPYLLPKESIHWLLYFTILAMLTSTYWDSSQWVQFITKVLYSIAIPRLLLDSYFRYIWGPIEAVIWWVCLAIAIYILWYIVLKSFSTLPSGGSVPFVYMGVSGGTALITALSGTLVIALHAGILVSLFIAIWVLTIVFLRSTNDGSDFIMQAIPDSASPLITFLFVGIWINGYFYAEVPSTSALMLAIAPIFALVERIKLIERMGKRKTVIIQIGLIALCVSIALIIAVVRSGLFGEDRY